VAAIWALAREKRGQRWSSASSCSQGVELANAFRADDVAEQRRRFDATAPSGRACKPTYPRDERFIAALGEGMPEAAGIALGLDRLVCS